MWWALQLPEKLWQNTSIYITARLHCQDSEGNEGGTWQEEETWENYNKENKFTEEEEGGEFTGNACRNHLQVSIWLFIWLSKQKHKSTTVGAHDTQKPLTDWLRFYNVCRDYATISTRVALLVTKPM